MERVTVWTKQHINVARELEETGRYIAKKDYIVKDLREHAPLVLEVYDWLVKKCPIAAQRPGDVEYPVWVSFREEATMLASDGAVILKLSLDPSGIAAVDINKWSRILNYSYIPADEQDEDDHRRLLQQYGVSDAKAYMSQFYPDIKKMIIGSWDRLFDETIVLGGREKYGIIWEVRKEWVRQ